MNTFKTADILIPKDIDLTAWSVIACDQYTSEPEYWEDVKNTVSGRISSFHIVFPEIYLESGETDSIIQSINATMDNYMKSGIFTEYKDAFVYVRRDIGDGRIRRGIVGAVDLEDYDFSPKSNSKIRATEGTVIERIPPRLKIRKNASLELPHIMLLIDDIEKTVIEPLESRLGELEEIYDFTLMKDSGRISGYLADEKAKEHIYHALSALEKQTIGKYGENPLLFAVGDGNHSLATAKTHWENIKKTLSESEQENHPARFALVEAVNIHDSTLEFEPIHRVVFGTNPSDLLDALKKYISKLGAHEMGKTIKCIHNGCETDICIPDINNTPVVGVLQSFLDTYLENSNAKIDYIHGEDVVKKLSSASSANIGFILPAMNKSELFSAVSANGPLPRKTFSMGEASEKRFYCEAKKIV